MPLRHETSDQAGNSCGARVAAAGSFGLGSHPNPFNPTTTLTFDVRAGDYVSLKVYDAAGRFVATLINEQKGAGLQRVRWNGRSALGTTVPSGIYFARLQIGNTVETHRMMLLK